MVSIIYWFTHTATVFLSHLKKGSILVIVTLLSQTMVAIFDFFFHSYEVPTLPVFIAIVAFLRVVLMESFVICIYYSFSSVT